MAVVTVAMEAMEAIIMGTIDMGIIDTGIIITIPS